MEIITYEGRNNKVNVQIFTHELSSRCCIIFHLVLHSLIICTICLKTIDENKVHREQRAYKFKM